MGSPEPDLADSAVLTLLALGCEEREKRAGIAREEEAWSVWLRHEALFSAEHAHYCAVIREERRERDRLHRYLFLREVERTGLLKALDASQESESAAAERRARRKKSSIIFEAAQFPVGSWVVVRGVSDMNGARGRVVGRRATRDARGLLIGVEVPGKGKVGLTAANLTPAPEHRATLAIQRFYRDRKERRVVGRTRLLQR
eukprot:Sspe_Gene.109930::Locus_90174_Transcript_2_2_Confidence_0.750_Length_655::g.109930::m.109930